MTDEEIRQLAERVRKEKYCNKYICEYGSCPLKQEGDGREWCIERYDRIYSLVFLDGFKEAMSICEQKLEIADTMLNASKQLTEDADKIKNGTFVKEV